MSSSLLHPPAPPPPQTRGLGLAILVGTATAVAFGLGGFLLIRDETEHGYLFAEVKRKIEAAK